MEEFQGLHPKSCLIWFGKKPPRTQAATGVGKTYWTGKLTIQRCHDGRKLGAGGLQTSNILKNKNLAERRPAKPVDSVEKYQRSFYRIETAGQIVFFPDTQSWVFVSLAVKFETKQNKYNKRHQPAEPPDFCPDGISVHLPWRLELLKCSVSCWVFFVGFFPRFCFHCANEGRQQFASAVTENSTREKPNERAQQSERENVTAPSWWRKSRTSSRSHNTPVEMHRWHLSDLEPPTWTWTQRRTHPAVTRR